VCQLKCSGAQGRCLMVTKDRRIGNQVRAGTRSQQPNEALVWKQETLLAMVSPLFPLCKRGVAWMPLQAERGVLSLH
jgi:hypothetical protein